MEFVGFVASVMEERRPQLNESCCGCICPERHPHEDLAAQHEEMDEAMQETSYWRDTLELGKDMNVVQSLARFSNQSVEYLKANISRRPFKLRRYARSQPRANLEERKARISSGTLLTVEPFQTPAGEFIPIRFTSGDGGSIPCIRVRGERAFQYLRGEEAEKWAQILRFFSLTDQSSAENTSDMQTVGGITGAAKVEETGHQWRTDQIVEHLRQHPEKKEQEWNDWMKLAEGLGYEDLERLENVDTSTARSGMRRRLGIGLSMSAAALAGLAINHQHDMLAASDKLHSPGDCCGSRILAGNKHVLSNGLNNLPLGHQITEYLVEHSDAVFPAALVMYFLGIAGLLSRVPSRRYREGGLLFGIFLALGLGLLTDCPFHTAVLDFMPWTVLSASSLMVFSFSRENDWTTQMNVATGAGGGMKLSICFDD